MKEQNAQMCYMCRKIRRFNAFKPWLLEKEKVSIVPTDGAWLKGECMVGE